MSFVYINTKLGRNQTQVLHQGRSTNLYRIKLIIKEIMWTIIFWIRFLEGLFPQKSIVNYDHKVTVINPTFSPERLKNVKRQTKILLKCAFIERIIISNHNPQVRIEEAINFVDDRLILIDQADKRGAGYRWVVVNSYQPKFIFSIDDDILLFPSQLARVLEELIKHPEVPHGIAGGYRSDYIRNRETEVDHLTQFYAITDKHLEKYFELVKEISFRDEKIGDLIELWGDDLLISNTGNGLPRIHKIGVFIQDRTASKPGVALFTYNGCGNNRKRIFMALKEVLDQK